MTMPNATPIPWGRLALCAALAMLTLTIPDVVLAQAGGDLAQPLSNLYRLVRGAIYAAAVLSVVAFCLAWGAGRIQWFFAGVMAVAFYGALNAETITRAIVGSA